MKKEYVKINDHDNNVTIINPDGMKRGDRLSDIDLEILEDIPQANKLSIVDIEKDEPIIRYGETIGYANKDIKKGELIDQNKIYIKTVDVLDINTPFKSRYIKNQVNNRDRYFYGYENKDGSVGTRNLLAISTNVQCSEGFVNVLIDYLKKNILPKYPNVDGIVPISHVYGCGVAINADNSEIPQRIISNILTNPNFGGEVMLVCIGCEKFTPDMIDTVRDEEIISQQDSNFKATFEKAIVMAEEKLDRLNKRVRTKQPLSKLKVGLQCGGSDALSGVTANPTIGYVADRLVEYGASVIFSEVTEVRDAAHILLERTKDYDLRRKLIDEMLWYDNYLDKSHADRSANPSPGNKKGGLATIIDKAMGSVAKSGTTDIVDVLSPGELIKKPGLTFAATPASDFVCGTCQVASGINLMLFSTGRGTTYNLEQVPVIKLSTNIALENKWDDLIDFKTGKLVYGETSISDLGEELIDYIVEVASGTIKTKADDLGLFNQLVVFNPAPIT